MSCGDLFVVPSANPCLGVKEIFAGTNVTITGSIYTPTINATGSSGGGVTSLAYTTGINGSAATGAITLSNTGVTSIVAGTGVSISGGTGAVTLTNTGITSLGAGTGISVSVSTITNTGVTSIIAGSGIGISGGTGAVTISNTSAGGITNLVAGSNITITNTSTINVISDPVFNNTMGFVGAGTNSVFGNVAYPYGSPTQYYPYMTNAGTDVLNTVGGRQFWATLSPGSSSVQVMRYRYDGIEAQQGSTGTTIPFLTFDNSTGLFGLSNTSNVVNSNIAGTGISLSGATGNVTITNTGVTSLVAGTNITITSTIGAYTINSSGGGGGVTSLAYTTGINGSAATGAITLSNTGVTSLIAGSNISITSTIGAYTVNTSGIGGSKNSRFTPVINGLWTAIDGDVELLDRALSFSVINNLDTAETIVVHFSCGPILGTSTAGPTNASYFSMKALVSPSAGGTPVATGAYGQYVVDYGATMGGDFVVVLSKSRGEFFADSSLMKLYKMDLPAAPFSSAILPAIAVPNIYVNIYAM